MSYNQETAKLVDEFIADLGLDLSLPEFREFLASSEEAGTEVFTIRFLENIKNRNSSRLTNYYGSDMRYPIGDFLLFWAKNQHFQKESYNYLQNYDSSGYFSAANQMRTTMFMNDAAVENAEGLGTLGKFSNNYNGTVAWLSKVRELRGDNFFNSIQNLSPFLQAGVVTSSEIIGSPGEETSPELVANLLKIDLKDHEMSLTYKAVRNLSRRYLRYGLLAPTSFKRSYRGVGTESRKPMLYDIELHDMFFNEYKIEIYDVFLERLKELVPEDSKKSTHISILSIASKYFFLKDGPGRFSLAAYNFYETYKDSYSVKDNYERFLADISSQSEGRESLSKWLSIITGSAKSDYDELPNDWLVKMIEAFS